MTTPQDQPTGDEQPADQTPPPPYYQQQPMPPPPGYAPQYRQPGTAQGYPPNSDEKLWSWLSHASFFVLGLIGPLIIMLVKGNESPFIRRHAVEALNFHISVLIYCIVSFVLIFVLIGIVTLIATFVFALIVTILAIIKAANGEEYRYPLNIRMVS
jgi:uncharacterized Tic20 family protein